MMNISPVSLSKKALFAPMIMTALFLGACSDNEAVSDDAHLDAQTPVEQEVTDVSEDELTEASVEHHSEDDVAIVKASDLQSEADIGIAEDDAALTGAEDQEHVSTY